MKYVFGGRASGKTAATMQSLATQLNLKSERILKLEETLIDILEESREHYYADKDLREWLEVRCNQVLGG